MMGTLRGLVHPALFAMLVIGLAACGPKSLPPIVDKGVVDEEARRQQETVLKDYLGRIDRLDRVAFTMLTKNADYCADVHFLAGMVVMDDGDVYSPYRDAARFIMKMDGRPRVMTVVPGGPADRAGLKVGDVVLEFQGQKTSGAFRMVKKMRENQWATLKVERDGAPVLAQVQQRDACAYPVSVREEQTINAFALKDRMLVTSAMVKFVRSDDELALILGHELAHINMDHLRAKRNNSMIGTILIDLPIGMLTGVNPGIGGALGAGAFSQDFETEADYVGLYNTARAGFDISGVAELWRRMATEYPGAIYTAKTHPTTANRFVVLEAARKEIEDKRAEGKPLRPQMKPQ